MPGQSVYDARDCPKCGNQINIKMKGSPWPLLLCNRCLKKENKRSKQEDRIERRIRGGHPLSAGLLKFQAETPPEKLENPTLKVEDLPLDVRNWLTQAKVSVEILEALSAPYGHALLALNSGPIMQGSKHASTANTCIKREPSVESEDAELLASADGQSHNKTLFVSGLHRNVKKTTLSLFFKGFTHEIPFIRHNWQVKGKNQPVCWAMVVLATPAEAARAIQELDGKEALKCKVSVKLHTPQTSVKYFDPQAYEETGRTLYIRGIEPDVTEDMLLSFMDDFEAQVHVIKNDYAIVQVSSSAEAQRAIDWLDKQRILKREIRVQINRNKQHEPVPPIHIRPARALTPVYRYDGEDEQKYIPRSAQDGVKQEGPRQGEYYAPQVSSDGGVMLPSKYVPAARLDHEIKREYDADRSYVDSLSPVSDVPSTGVSPDNSAGGGGEWVSGVLNDILQMEMASRPSSWLDVSLTVQRELRHQLMMDITEGDPREGTPICVPLLELLDHRVKELRRLWSS